MLYISYLINSGLQVLHTVKLNDVTEAIELQHEGLADYLNKKTGELFLITEEEFKAAENREPPDDHPEWQRDGINAAREILDNEEDFITLPDEYEIHEYRIMEKFCLSIANRDISEDMYNAIKGRGAFSRFEERLNRYGIADQWYEYREEAIRRIAIDWCESNHIPHDGG
jgi:hypothetical protein